MARKTYQSLRHSIFKHIKVISLLKQIILFAR
jgi:hypothetical protein